jgi:MFS family permease
VRELLRNKNFILFWVASAIASIASLTLQFVVSLYAFDLTGSAALFGFILSIVIVPRLLLYPVAGVWADRYNRKLLLVIPTALMFVVLSGFSAWHLLFSTLAVPHLFALVIALEAFDCLFFTLSAVIPPMIVRSDLLGAANSLGTLYAEFGYFIGVLLGSAIYAAFGFGFSLLGVTISFIVCLVFMLLLRLPAMERSEAGDAVHTERHPAKQAENGEDVRTEHHPQKQGARGEAVREGRAPRTTGFIAELREGLQVVLKDSLIARLLLFAPAFNFALFPLWDLVLLFFLRGELGMDVAHFGAFMAFQSVATVAASLGIAKIYTDARVVRFIRLEPPFLLGCVAILIVAVFLAPFVPLWVVVVLAFIGSNLVSIAANVFVVGKNTLIQKRVAKGKQSRVFSINRLTALAAMPIGNFVFGLVVEGFGVFAALLLSCVGVIGMFFIARPLKLSMLDSGTDPGEAELGERLGAVEAREHPDGAELGERPGEVEAQEHPNEAELSGPSK